MLKPTGRKTWELWEHCSRSGSQCLTAQASYLLMPSTPLSLAGLSSAFGSLNVRYTPSWRWYSFTLSAWMRSTKNTTYRKLEARTWIFKLDVYLRRYHFRTVYRHRNLGSRRVYEWILRCGWWCTPSSNGMARQPLTGCRQRHSSQWQVSSHSLVTTVRFT